MPDIRVGQKEDVGSESGSDGFEETVRREHLRFLERQRQKKEAAATGRAWSAPARPITLSSPSSASQRKRSAERSAERVLVGINFSLENHFGSQFDLKARFPEKRQGRSDHWCIATISQLMFFPLFTLATACSFFLPP